MRSEHTVSRRRLPPDLPPPISPDLALPSTPMPSNERIGVNSADTLSITLEMAIEMALRNNNDIDSSRNDSQITDLRLDGARGVYDPLITSDNYYERATTPTASAIGGAVNGAVTQTRFFNSAGVSGFTPAAGGSYSVLFNSSRTTTSNTNSFLNPQYPSSMTFNYTQPLMRDRKFDGNRRSIEIAKRNRSISDAQLRIKAIDVISGVESAYWDLTFALRNLQVQTDTLKQAKEQLESNKRLVAKGVLAPIEIVAANAQISTFEQTVFLAQENVTRAENSLKTLLLPDRASPEWVRPLTPVTPVSRRSPDVTLDVAVQQAMKNRPEVDQWAVTEEINKIDERYFRDQKKPQIDLYGIYTTAGLAGTETPAAISPTTGLSRVPSNLVGGYFNSLETYSNRIIRLFGSGSRYRCRGATERLRQISARIGLRPNRSAICVRRLSKGSRQRSEMRCRLYVRRMPGFCQPPLPGSPQRSCTRVNRDNSEAEQPHSTLFSSDRPICWEHAGESYRPKLI
ncbi:MAG: TolC family protein [Chloracidobacterium sp.]|nr:TolC family protein [Chloracidobacterium sp.]